MMPPEHDKALYDKALLLRSGSREWDSLQESCLTAEGRLAIAELERRRYLQDEARTGTL